jgi:ATP-dependent DNA ligase
MTWVKPSLVAEVKFAEWTSESGLGSAPGFPNRREDSCRRPTRER